MAESKNFQTVIAKIRAAVKRGDVTVQKKKVRRKSDGQLTLTKDAPMPGEKGTKSPRAHVPEPVAKKSAPAVPNAFTTGTLYNVLATDAVKVDGVLSTLHIAVHESEESAKKRVPPLPVGEVLIPRELAENKEFRALFNMRRKTLCEANKVFAVQISSAGRTVRGRGFKKPKLVGLAPKKTALTKCLGTNPIN